MTSCAKLRLGRLSVDCVTFAGALDAIGEMVASGEGGAVFTPNVDHVVLADEDARFRLAYENVDLALADGMPVVWASHLLGAPIPEKISGSDLVPRLLARAETDGWRVFLLGGGEGVAKEAAARLRRSHPRLKIVGTAAPRIETGAPKASHERLLAQIKETTPHLVLVGLGAPKQEIWIDEVASALSPAVLLGVGASLDFLAGTAKRAPRWISASGMEWAYRLLREPRRLWRRYLLRDPRFVAILLAALFARVRGAAT